MTKATIQRQKLIANFIDSGNISSQNQLKGMLKKNGTIITQATLSRDLNELGAVKKRLKNGNLQFHLIQEYVFYILFYVFQISLSFSFCLYFAQK